MFNYLQWDNVSEPVLTCNLTRAELRELVNKPMEVPFFPSNTQSVERGIRRVSEASQKSQSPEKREGIILSQMEACKILPVSNTKKDFVELVKFSKSGQ